MYVCLALGAPPTPRGCAPQARPLRSTAPAGEPAAPSEAFQEVARTPHAGVLLVSLHRLGLVAAAVLLGSVGGGGLWWWCPPSAAARVGTSVVGGRRGGAGRRRVGGW